MPARLFNIQKYSIYDGPGIRTLVFFKGCPLNCLWCSNPEGKSHACQILWNASLCNHCGLCASLCPTGAHGMENGAHKIAREKCSGCGECQKACPQRALKLAGNVMETPDILKIVLEDKAFYDTSGGGVTLGGGEPLAQPAAALDLLKACRAAGIHTAMETCGFASHDVIGRIAPHVNIFLYDIKHTDKDSHLRLTGADNAPILANLAWLLDNGHEVRVRMPLIEGCNAAMAEIEERAVFLEKWRHRENFSGVDLLPYHKLGVHKYAQLGEDYRLGRDAAVDDEFLQTAVAMFGEHGIRAAIVRH